MTAERAVDVLRLDHTSLALDRISSAVGLFRDLLGGELVVAWDPGGGAFRDIKLRYPSGAAIELMEPRGAGFLRDFLDRRGEGVHHITFMVRDLDQALEAARAFGYAVVQESRESPLWHEAFLGPRAACGTVVQLAYLPDPAEYARTSIDATGAAYHRPDGSGNAGIGVLRFDHTSLALNDLDEGLRLFRDFLGGRLVRYRCLEDRVNAVVSFPGGGRIELMEPLVRRGFLRRFIAQRGPGVHHLTFFVGDLRDAVARVRAFGYPVAGESYANPHWYEAFLPPRTTHGALVQLVQTDDTHLGVTHTPEEIAEARARHLAVRAKR